MKIIEIKNLFFSYKNSDETGDDFFKVLDDINLDIEDGEFICILGHNGSGKSTLARHLNGTLCGDKGEVLVNSRSTSNKDELNLWEIKKDVGIVFQNPDNQIVATIVSDDVAFGVENLGLDRATMQYRIDKALKSVDMYHLKDSAITNLSGGQKQRVAIAGVLAMEQKCIVLDEPTSMLDPKGRSEVLETIKALNKQGITIILVTHFMEEAILSDRVLVMDKGKILLDDSPISVFKNVDLLKSIKLDVPPSVEIWHSLCSIKNNLNDTYIDFTDLSLESFAKTLSLNYIKKDITPISIPSACKNDMPMMDFKNINYIYNKGEMFEKVALKNINLCINDGDFFGIIGHTGSGKSTLISLFNAILKPTFINDDESYILLQNKNIKDFNLKELRTKIGVVFQYPEYQLFEESVYKDVAFAPKNMGLSKEEIHTRVIDALDFVNIDESYFKKHPLDLSGGEKRRVAIAGILAMKPKLLVFDELTAGLDPFSRDDILNKIIKMQKELGLTVVLVSHSMEDIAKCCNKAIVLNNGEIFYNGSIKEVFKDGKTLENIGLDIPRYSKLFHLLNTYGYDFQTDIYNLKDCVNLLSQNLRI